MMTSKKLEEKEAERMKQEKAHNKKSTQRKNSVGESNKNVFLIQIGASNFAEFEITEFE